MTKDKQDIETRGERRVAIQGVAGCFHDAAAREYFTGDIVRSIECDTFEGLVNTVATDSGTVGLMAIENTIAGALLPNHELLRRADVRIVGEHKKRISHVLAALPGQHLGDITCVESHPMALMQCEDYLTSPQTPAWSIVEAFDTAGAARNIAVNKVAAHAAVCPAWAAELYGLDILARGIETNKHNFTRFLVIEKGDARSDNERHIDKASVVFSLPHTQGALSKVLAIWSFYELNLSKIQSLPIVGREWEYRFYVDLTFDDVVRYRQAIDAAKPLMRDFKLLGEYEMSSTPAVDDVI